MLSCDKMNLEILDNASLLTLQKFVEDGQPTPPVRPLKADEIKGPALAPCCVWWKI